MEGPAIDTDNIPLVCKICPKKPEFSDISHLLTHIGSKGHLSNYYKTQVLGAHDREAQRLVAEYDDWYARHNVQDLMSQRLGQKAERKSRNESVRRRQEDVATQPSHQYSTLHRPNEQAQYKCPDDKGMPQIKSEYPPLSSMMSGIYQNNSHTLYSLPLQYLHDWHSLPFASHTWMNSPSVKYATSGSIEPGESPATFALSSASTRWLPNSNLDMSIQAAPPIDEQSAINETILDSSKMKGVYWEGMAMFDSATPEMKKKRNQKKASSVLEQLQATSEIVRPSEMVFDTEWIHRRTRTITGSPVDSNQEESPLEGESTPEPDFPKRKKSKRPRRRALVERDVNSGGLKRMNDRKRKAAIVPKKEPSHSTPRHEDDDLTYKALRPRKRRGLSIHRDNSGPDITFNEPNPLPYLTSGHGPAAVSHRLPRTGDVHNSPLTFASLCSAQNANMSTVTAFRPTSIFATGIPGLPNLSSFGHLGFGNQSFFHPAMLSSGTPNQLVGQCTSGDALLGSGNGDNEGFLPPMAGLQCSGFNNAYHDTNSVYSSNAGGAPSHSDVAAAARVSDASFLFGCIPPPLSNEASTTTSLRDSEVGVE